MADSSVSQLSLFSNDNGERPLPLIVAEKWEFPLQHHLVDNTWWYSPTDWIAGLIGRKTASQTWRNIKFKNESVFSVNELPYAATDGKTYNVDFVTDKGLYWVVQHLRSRETRPALSAIREYLASAGALVDDLRRNPEHAADIAITGYAKRGHSNDWIKERLETIEDYKLLCMTVDRVCDAPRYGEIVNTEYRAIYGMIAEDLKALLNTKKIRDALPQLQLQYIHMAETALRLLLDESERMTHDQICQAAKVICEPLGDHLKQVSALLNVHHVTGRPLLTGGTHD